MTNSSDEFRLLVLEGLYNEVYKGNGTDLEVLIPKSGGGTDDQLVTNKNNDSSSMMMTFHLHQNIVASSSRYFATFPEPKSGRIIHDIDSDVFSAIVKFMYIGDLVLSLDNVSSILHAAELLLIDRLKNECITFLENNLDHSNYESVIELADQFNIPDLKTTAKRFQSENSARDELVGKKESLVRRLEIVKHDESNLDTKKTLEKELEGVELQLKTVFQKQHEDALLSRWEENQSNLKDDKDSSATTIPFAFGSGRIKGSVGHLVPKSFDRYEVYDYVGTSQYGDDIDPDVDDNQCSPPPAPTKEMYEKYGIVTSHPSLNDAIKAANAGDRIYLEKGVHCDHDNMGTYFDPRGALDGVTIEKAVEIIGLGDRSEVIVEIDIADDQQFLVKGPSAGFYNITFCARKGKGKYRGAGADAYFGGDYPPNNRSGVADDAVIKFKSGYLKAVFTVRNCIFDMGADSSTAFPTRVSGIFLQDGMSATIEGCTFLGGAGSAIVALNDPFLYFDSIEITRNKFVSCGQPSFSEICTAQVKDDSKSQGIWKRVPIPSDEVTPGPSAVELWRFNRTCYKISKCGEREKHKTVAIKMVDNTFTSNLRAPIAYRAIVPKWKSKEKNTWRLHVDLDSDEDPNSLASGFDMTLKDNVFKSNGLSFDEEAIRKMRGAPLEKKEKKLRLETCKFPDGYSLLSIQHIMTYADENSFPYAWGNDEPFDEYRLCYTEESDY